MCRCGASPAPSLGGKQRPFPSDKLRRGGHPSVYRTFISLRRRLTLCALFLEWWLWALLCFYLSGFDGRGCLCAALFFRRGPGFSYRSFLFPSVPHHESQPPVPAALLSQLSVSLWPVCQTEPEELGLKEDLEGFAENRNLINSLRSVRKAKTYSFHGLFYRRKLKDLLSSGRILGFLVASPWMLTARHLCYNSSSTFAIPKTGVVLSRHFPRLSAFSRPRNICVNKQNLFQLSSPFCVAYCTPSGCRTGGNEGNHDTERGAERGVTSLNSNRAHQGETPAELHVSELAVTGSLLSLECRRGEFGRRKVRTLCLASSRAALPIHDSVQSKEEKEKAACDKHVAEERQRSQAKRSCVTIASKASTRRKRRSSSGPQPVAPLRPAVTVETVEAAFADVVEAVQHCTGLLRSFDAPVQRERFLKDEHSQADGHQSVGNEVSKEEVNSFSCRSEKPAAETANGNTVTQNERAQSRNKWIPGLTLGLPPVVKEAVSKFKHAARDLLGLRTSKQKEIQGTQDSATAFERAGVGKSITGEKNNSETSTTGKSCVWFDVTKHRLMVDRQELMKELGETSKGSWTLRFLGTGAMQASVTRNTSAILFSRGDGVSWLFDCGGGASATAFPPQPSSVVRPRFSPFLEKLTSTSWMRPHLLSPSHGGTLLHSSQPAQLINSKKRRLRELALQRKQADLEKLLVQPSYAAAVAIAGAAVADRAAPGEGGDTEQQVDERQGTRPAAPLQTARKKRVSRIGKIFVTHLHGDHSLGIPSLLSQVAAGALLQREATEATASKFQGSSKPSSDCGDTGEPRPSCIDASNSPVEGRRAPRTDHKQEGRTTRDSSRARKCQEATAPNDDASDGMPVVDIIGPEGLRNLLRAIFVGTHVRRCARYRVHELKGVPCLHHGRRCSHPTLPELPKAPFEAEGGIDLWPSANGSYEVFSDRETKVLAVPIRHNVPTVGYVVEELGRTRRRLRAAALEPVVQRNLHALAEWPALRGQPKAVFKLLAALQPGDSFTFPDGTRIDYSDAFEEEAHHLRKLCICVDTCDASLIEQFAKGCDMMIHESTLSESGGVPDNGLGVDGKDDFINDYLPYDGDKAWPGRFIEQGKTKPNHTNLGKDAAGECAGPACGSVPGVRTRSKRKWTALDEEAFARGHSTAAMAGDFAGRAGAQRLVLTHFSQRFKGDASLTSVALMKSVEQEALNAMLNAERSVCQATFDNVQKEGGQDCVPRNATTSQNCASDHGSPPRVLAAFDGMTLHIRKRRANPAQATLPRRAAERAHAVDVTDGEEALKAQGARKG
ncbi:hypothetical protein TGARI_258590 [Toxoplasma gondii ARI]|uniref:Transmembrane protein n=1 Tax=Toxoplasma gondii ARI TaxID=1074872 RepID=A0A139XSF1_TOXGO|nr:hypothetical protein TGARI_258590 [Toxoplasma gondii ARI]